MFGIVFKEVNGVFCFCSLGVKILKKNKLKIDFSRVGVYCMVFDDEGVVLFFLEVFVR